MSQKRILIVEDSPYQYQGVRERLEKAAWEVVNARDLEDAFYQINLATREGKTFNVVAVDLGLMPLPDSYEQGLKLAKQLRSRYENLPILAYTGQGPRAFEYDLVLRELLAYRVSFVYLRPGDDIILERILEVIPDGHLIVSSTPASYLSSAIPVDPDPLEEKYWQLLRLLYEGFTYIEAGSSLGYTRDTINNWVKDIKRVLSGLLQPDEVVDESQITLDDLVQWYITHRIRYCRD